jgi:hypothetical protein
VLTDERDPVFERPVFIMSAPRSGSTLLFETLQRAPGLYTIGGESHRLIETIPTLGVADRGFDSNRLLASDATPAVSAELRARFRNRAVDRDRSPAPAGARFRLLEKTPKNALRIPFLRAVFPEARFVYLHRDPRQVLASMIDAWLSGKFQTYLDLPGWPYPYWALLLTPGWRGLAGLPLPRIVAAQWQRTMEVMLDDLQSLPAGGWTALRYDAFIAQPDARIEALCQALDLAWDQPLGHALPLSRHTLSPPDPEKWRRHAAVIEPLLPGLRATIDRAERMAGAAD